MLKKVLIGCGAVTLLLLVGMAVAAWWLLRAVSAEPEFYAEAAVEEPAAEDAAAFESAAARIVAITDASNSEEPREGEPIQPEITGETFEPDPPPGADDGGRQTIVIYDRDVNAYLALNATAVNRQLSAGFTDPRVSFADGRVKIGVRVRNQRFRGVLAGEVEPVVLSPEEAELRLVGFRIGRIPFPIDEMTGTADESGLPAGIGLDVSTPPPRFTFDWDAIEGATTRVVGVDVGDGSLTLTLEPLPQTPAGGDEPEEGDLTDEVGGDENTTSEVDANDGPTRDAEPDAAR